jgi:hypothetical protein
LHLEPKVSHMAWKPPLPPLGFWLACALVAASGCQEQESIRHYLAPKDRMPEPPAIRMLAVMVPRAKEAWFFKFQGPEKEVTKHEADFDALLRSVRFTSQDDEPIAFETPPQWKRKVGPRPRYATLMLGRKGEGLEISITKLGPESSDVRKNVDRWRNQLGLPPLDDDAFGKLRNNSKVDGVEATRVDLVGVRQEEAMPKKMPPQAARESLPFHYTTPDGWEARPPLEKRGVFLPLVFRIRGDGGEAEMTAMSLRDDGGGVALNVNRWRGQVGLASVDAEQIQRQAKTLKVGDKRAVYVDLSGPGGGTAKRILGVILPLGRETWFFTFKGSSELVGKEQSHFEAFITSLRLNDEAGAAHE